VSSRRETSKNFVSSLGGQEGGRGGWFAGDETTGVTEVTGVSGETRAAATAKEGFVEVVVTSVTIVASEASYSIRRSISKRPAAAVCSEPTIPRLMKTVVHVFCVCREIAGAKLWEAHGKSTGLVQPFSFAFCLCLLLFVCF
jgi:hypothetical protein